MGAGSSLDLLVMRDRDANTAWTTASDGTLEERLYYCQNWRADVSAIVDSSGQMMEWVKYSAYGVPFGLPGGDADSDGDCDSTDESQVQSWIDASAYDVRGDIDLDGDVDSTDKSTIQGTYSGTSLGRGTLSAVGNRRGAAAMIWQGDSSVQYLARVRSVDSSLGRWTTRDPLMYSDGPSLYIALKSNPIRDWDPMGLTSASSVGPRKLGTHTRCVSGKTVEDSLTLNFTPSIYPSWGMDFSVQIKLLQEFPAQSAVFIGGFSCSGAKCNWQQTTGLSVVFKASLSSPCGHVSNWSIFPCAPIGTSPCGDLANFFHFKFHGTQCGQVSGYPTWEGLGTHCGSGQCVGAGIECNGSSQCNNNVFATSKRCDQGPQQERWSVTSVDDFIQLMMQPAVLETFRGYTCLCP